MDRLGSGQASLPSHRAFDVLCQTWLEYNLQRKLNLAFWRGRSLQLARDATRCRGLQRACPIKDIGVAVTGSRGSKVGMIENIEHFRAELHVKGLGDSLDLVVLED